MPPSHDEAQQRDSGTPIIKLFLHVTQDEQDERFRKRLDNPWKRWKLTADDFRNREKREPYLEALRDMFERTDTRWAPGVLDEEGKPKGLTFNAYEPAEETPAVSGS